MTSSRKQECDIKRPKAGSISTVCCNSIFRAIVLQYGMNFSQSVCHALAPICLRHYSVSQIVNTIDSNAEEIMSVELLVEDHTAQITLNNPDKRNVLDVACSAQLARAVADAEANPNVSCIVIAAAGRAFCAGGSLDELLRAQAGEAELLNEIYAGFLAVANSPLPTVAAVQGAAVGAGMNLALACDIRIVTPRAKFDTRFMQLGIHCGGGHSWMLQKFLNWEESAAALIFGQVISGEQALARGLATECVKPDELLLACHRLAAGLKGVPRELIEETKRSLHKSRSEPNHEVMVAHEFLVQTHSLAQDHAKARLESFRQRISQ